MNAHTRTKVICTIGPSCNTLEMMKELIRSGMNVARLNFSHGTLAEHLLSIQNLKKARDELKVPLAIMLDTKGPEIRLGKIKDGQILLQAGHIWLLKAENVEGNEHSVTITPHSVLKKLEPGQRVLFDDGYVGSRVLENRSDGVVVKIENSGVIRSGKGVNIPNVSLDLPALTEKDMDDIRFGCENDIDLIAASFIRSADNVLAIRKLLTDHKKADTLIIAKIENHEGVQNFDSIIQVADGVMIARGDLGVEVPLSQVPRLQKMMIRKCYLAGKPSVTATQMLESMIHNPRPTRAEASDVANAIYDSTSAVMLSGETAIGKYPLETVQVMGTIIREAEEDFNYPAFFDQHAKFVYHDVPSAVTLATVKTAYSSSCKAIFAFTSSGSTARLLSRLRPSMPIVAVTPFVKTYHQLSFNWGVVPVLRQSQSLREAYEIASAYALESNFVEYGDLVLMTAGTPFGIAGTTNMMVVESIGDVLVRGTQGYGAHIHGNVIPILSSENIRPYRVRGCIIVISRYDDSYQFLVQEATGVILQNNIEDVDSEKNLLEFAKKINRSCIVRADDALHILKEGQLITLAPEKALVYKGVVL